MELRLLRYFLAVAREENITRAAEVLHITQPSLSKQLMELEQELGKQLFIRGKRKITLTEEGILLRKRADEILMLCEKTQREIAQDSDLIGGVISIGGAQSPVVAQATALIANKVSWSKVSIFQRGCRVANGKARPRNFGFWHSH